MPGQLDGQDRKSSSPYPTPRDSVSHLPLAYLAYRGSSPAAAVATGTGWQVDSYVTVRISGSGGKCLGNLKVAATAPAKTAQTATVTVNTTVANFLSLTLIGGGTNPVVTVVNAFASTLQQSGPPQAARRASGQAAIPRAVKQPPSPTLDRRHFSVVRPAHAPAFELLP